MFKKIFFFIIFIALVSYGGYRWYRHTHPVIITPPPAREEVTVTIIPGWNLRQVAEYLVLKHFASSTNDVYRVTGLPAVDYRILNRGIRSDEMLSTNLTVAKDKPVYVSYEGYLAPETYRVFADAGVDDVIQKLLAQRDKQITDDMYAAAAAQGRSWHDIMTMASILEDEAKTVADKKIVADIMWRRIGQHWALQVDSSVHYAIDKTGTVYTTGKERDVLSPWNTYKYVGLPPGPISNPSLDSIDAALYPTKNDYWYFLSGRDGAMHYAQTLDEHAANKKYL